MFLHYWCLYRCVYSFRSPCALLVSVCLALLNVDDDMWTMALRSAYTVPLVWIIQAFDATDSTCIKGLSARHFWHQNPEPVTKHRGQPFVPRGANSFSISTASCHNAPQLQSSDGDCAVSPTCSSVHAAVRCPLTAVEHPPEAHTPVHHGGQIPYADGSMAYIIVKPDDPISMFANLRLLLVLLLEVPPCLSSNTSCRVLLLVHVYRRDCSITARQPFHLPHLGQGRHTRDLASSWCTCCSSEPAR